MSCNKRSWGMLLLMVQAAGAVNLHKASNQTIWGLGFRGVGFRV